ncbi:MAG TPA: glycosyltransferase family 9 protein [Bacteroidales bacterium]|nr:glycosyltransferase family 9 protein [Bacteroidales bacterium]
MPDLPETKDSWFHFMRQGMFEEAWNHSDSVLRTGANRDYINLPRHYQCIWDGSSLEGKCVLVRCYHGLGDTIQFVRYVPMLKKIAKEVNLWVQPRLIELFHSVKGIDRLIPLHDGAPGIEYDADIEIMELPHYFRTTASTIPSEFPYIYVEPRNFDCDNQQFSAGIVWKAGDWDKSRNIDFEYIKPLFSIKGLKICILQNDATDAGWKPGYGIHPGKCTLLEHAEIIKGLDVMISIDSMPAHLAGALNVPVWLLLNSEADWRWMENRTDTPWYPSMQIFRKEKKENWPGLIKIVMNSLKKLID